MVVPAGHKWAKRKSIRPDELAAEQPILLDIGHCFREQVLDACPELSRAEAHVTRTSSLETVRNMVASGLGVSVLPRDALTPQVSQPAGRAHSVHAPGAVATRRARAPQELSAAGGDQGDTRGSRRLPDGDVARPLGLEAWPGYTSALAGRPCAGRRRPSHRTGAHNDCGSQGQGRADHRSVDGHRRRGGASVRRRRRQGGRPLQREPRCRGNGGRGHQEGRAAKPRWSRAMSRSKPT